MSYEGLRVVERPGTPRRHYDPVIVWLSAINAAVFLAVVILILAA